MAITYPLQLPDNGAGIESFRLIANHAVGVLRSPFTFATQTQRHPGQAWSVEVGIAPCREDGAEPWMAFLLRLNGPHGTFLMGDPWHRSPRGTATGSPEVRGNHAARAATLLTGGWTANTAGILLEGDYIQIGERLHKVLLDADSDASGQATLEIFPALRVAVADSEAIITEEPKGLFRLADAESTLTEIDKERFYSISFTAMEAV
jgi:hypothetical protein